MVEFRFDPWYDFRNEFTTGNYGMNRRFTAME